MTRSFDRETYFRLVDIAQERRAEAKRCSDAGAHLAACVLEAAALEAVLLVTAANHEEELRARDAWPNGDPRDWNLGQVFVLAKSEGWFRETSVALEEAAQVAKWARNLVHPGAFVRDVPHGATLDEHHSRAAYETLEVVWGATWATINIGYPEDAQTFLARVVHGWRSRGGRPK